MSEENSVAAGGFEGKNSKSDTKEKTSLKLLRLMLNYLARLYNNRGKPIAYADLQRECKAWGIRGDRRQLDMIKWSIDWLIRNGFPIVKTDDNKVYWDYLKASQLLDGTKVLVSLYEDVVHKAHLAKKAVDILLEKTDPKLKLNVFMGIGTTVHAVFREMLERRALGKLQHLDTVYTDNLLIVFEYMHHEELGFNLGVLDGRLYRDWTRIGFDKKHLGNNRPVSLSITSFKGFNKDFGFSSDDLDEKNKKMSLKPHKDCGIVIVPISLYRFGSPGTETDIVAGINDLRENTEYIFVTDDPVLPRDAIKKEHGDKLLEETKERKLDVKIQHVLKEANSKGRGKAEIQVMPSKQRSQQQLKPPVG